MQRPPTAKMRGGRKPRTMLAPKPPEPADMDEAANQPVEFALKVNLAPQRARTHISFGERQAELDPAKNRRPKLVLFEHHQGSRVYDGLFPDYQLPNGKKAFFYFESKMVEEVEVLLRAPVPPPVTLTQALQVGNARALTFLIYTIMLFVRKRWAALLGSFAWSVLAVLL